MYGIKLNKNEKYFNVEKLLKLVDEAWMEEEDYSEDDVITFFQQPNQLFLKNLENIQNLSNSQEIALEKIKDLIRRNLPL
ncbi:hypothetical protein [Thermoanaerobacter uzonensis]|uniref:hypothetical protein n=1 Tax=Thermoanaerobacter uzonensis TaxID=447593 RepID=UPI003D7687F2